ncbi:MAG: pancreas/duodenum homeobox protein 1 [Desulfarculaceae bacterium]|nr:pancreas/duodenum homeobox protein 1 [Desulfarculaceae bacterium]MCF8072877.1 pancreas/duodenum homeobox protein 1 [Desulfarculaceae bacterium]MCF8101045.1 pancreas/duodenum homeobox protein 1 [Desulfarculaceae bacterium]MCF8115568.1 pancreas/duodenum homeobox protein 1 [Desulfarculaceae bacterium]
MSPANNKLDPEQLAGLMPTGLADEFFDALYGDAAEGAYDIELALKGQEGARLELELRLKQRPGKCLACNLTYGLPQVFSRHPVLDLKGLVARVCQLAGTDPERAQWELGHTRPVSDELHAIPLYIELGD